MKKVGIIKRIFALLLIFLLSINSFGAVVSDNDGSAFITKAEFDSLKNNFQSQIDNYNQSIDSKIDGAIAQYLEGIQISNVRPLTPLMPAMKFIAPQIKLTNINEDWSLSINGVANLSSIWCMGLHFCSGLKTDKASPFVEFGFSTSNTGTCPTPAAGATVAEVKDLWEKFLLGHVWYVDYIDDGAGHTHQFLKSIHGLTLYTQGGNHPNFYHDDVTTGGIRGVTSNIFARSAGANKRSGFVIPLYFQSFSNSDTYMKTGQTLSINCSVDANSGNVKTSFTLNYCGNTSYSTGAPAYTSNWTYTDNSSIFKSSLVATTIDSLWVTGTSGGRDYSSWRGMASRDGGNCAGYLHTDFKNILWAKGNITLPRLAKFSDQKKLETSSSMSDGNDIMYKKGAGEHPDELTNNAVIGKEPVFTWTVENSNKVDIGSMSAYVYKDLIDYKAPIYGGGIVCDNNSGDDGQLTVNMKLNNSANISFKKTPFTSMNDSSNLVSFKVGSNTYTTYNAAAGSSFDAVFDDFKKDDRLYVRPDATTNITINSVSIENK